MSYYPLFVDYTIRWYHSFCNGVSFMKMRCSFLGGRNFFNISAVLLSENSLSCLASSFVRYLANFFCYLVAFLASPSIIGFWNTFLKINSLLNILGFIMDMQVYSYYKLFWMGVPVSKIRLSHLNTLILSNSLLFLFFNRWPSSKIIKSHLPDIFSICL